MKTRKGWFELLASVCFTGSLVLLDASRAGADEAKAVPKTQAMSEMDTDVRLERKVSWNETDITLASLLSSLSRKDLTLVAGPSCTEQKLQLKLKQRSLRVLMQSLAELLPGEWHSLPNRNGYVLNLTEHAFHLRQNWLDLWRRERERVHAARRDALLRAMRATPNISRPDDPGPDVSNAAGYAHVMSSFHFFQTLPASLQEQIAVQQNDLRDVINPVSGDLITEDVVRVPWKSLPEATRAWVKEGKTYLHPTMIRDLDQPGTQAVFINIGSNVMATINMADGRRGLLPYIDTMESETQLATANDEWLTELVKQVKMQKRPVPDTWQEMAARLQSRVWPNAKPAIRPTQELSRRRADQLNRLAHFSDIEYVADYYSASVLWSPPMMAAEKAAPLAHPLAEELNIMAAVHHLSWKQRDGGLYLLRDNRWYHDDYLEVPDALALRWLAPYTTKPDAAPASVPNAPQTDATKLKAQMDWDSEAVALLTPWQIGMGLKNLAVDVPTDAAQIGPENTPPAIGTRTEAARNAPPQDVTTCFPFAYAAERLLYEANTARFYANLNETMRVALAEQNLAFAALSPQQQAKAMRLLPNADELAASGRVDAIVLGVKPFGHGGGAIARNGRQVDTRPLLCLTARIAP